MARLRSRRWHTRSGADASTLRQPAETPWRVVAQSGISVDRVRNEFRGRVHGSEQGHELRLAYLEGTLGSYLRDRYPEQDEAVVLLPRGSRAAHAKLALGLRSTDTLIDDLACLSLKDLIDIAGKDTNFREIVSSSSFGWGRATQGLANFRNAVMHPTRPISGAGVDRPENFWTGRTASTPSSRQCAPRTRS